MATVTEFITTLTVVSASGLPKTDTFSAIDAYVVLKLGSQKFKTRTIQNNQLPFWDQSFLPVVTKHPSGFLTGTLQIELHDENVFKDELVCTGALNFDDFKHPQELAHLQVPLTNKKSKHTGSPVLELRFQGFVQSYFSMKNMFSPVPGIVWNEQAKSCYIPIPDFQGLLYVAVEYEGASVDFKVYSTQPHGKALFIDMVNQAGTLVTKAIRRTYPRGRQICTGLVVYDEVKLDGIAINTDFTQLCAVVFDCQHLSTTSAAQVVKVHGWRGALDFHDAANSLHSVLIDHQNEEIYMQVDPNETLLLVDYDNDDVDIKLAILANPATADKGYDLTIRGQDCKKYTKVWLPHKAKLNGQVLVSRLYELDDVDYGTSFNDIEINRYQLRNPRTYSFQSLTRIMG